LLVVDSWYRFHQSREFRLEHNQLGRFDSFIAIASVPSLTLATATTRNHVAEEGTHFAHHQVSLFVRAPIVETVLAAQLATAFVSIT
jgi:hypothetical protein